MSDEQVAVESSTAGNVETASETQTSGAVTNTADNQTTGVDPYEAAEQQIRNEDAGEQSAEQDESPSETQANAAPPNKSGTTPDISPAQPAPVELNDEQKQLLSRFKIQASHLPADPHVRNALLANLKQRHDDQAKMYREVQELKAALEQKQSKQADEQPLPADEQKILDELGQLDPGLPTHVKGLVQSMAQRLISPYQQQLEQARQTAEMQGQMLYDLHLQQGLDEVRKHLPDTILLDDSPQGKANQQKLLDEAIPLLQANQHPTNFNLRHAIVKARLLAFPQEIQLAERAKLKSSQDRARRGNPQPGRATVASKPAYTTDELYQRIEEAIEAGLPDSEIEKLASVGRG